MIGVFQRTVGIVGADARPERAILWQGRILNGADDFGFIVLAFLGQFANALGIHIILGGKALRITGLPGILGIGLVIMAGAGAGHPAVGTSLVFKSLLLRGAALDGIRRGKFLHSIFVGFHDVGQFGGRIPAAELAAAPHGTWTFVAAHRTCNDSIPAAGFLFFVRVSSLPASFDAG
jgi:hypothetical protein